jgi:hypothetical protein
MVFGAPLYKEECLANQSHEQITQLTLALESSAHNKEMSLSCILRVLMLLVFYSQEL